jgi:hypothetical protein
MKNRTWKLYIFTENKLYNTHAQLEIPEMIILLDTSVWKKALRRTINTVVLQVCSYTEL